MKLSFLAEALNELEVTRDYYLEHANLNVTTAFLNEVEHASLRVLEFSKIGAAISPRLRILQLRHFPYSLIYAVNEERILIVAIAAQRRRPGYWRERIA